MPSNNMCVYRAQVNQLDFALLQAVIATESGFVPTPGVAKGAVGLMQVMPATGERYGLTSDRPEPWQPS